MTTKYIFLFFFVQETLATFIKWNVDMPRSSGAVCHQDPR